MIYRSQAVGRAAQVLWGMLGRSTEVNKICQNLISGDHCFILGILLPLPQNKPCVVVPKTAAHPCWIGGQGGLMLCVGYLCGFCSPWMRRGSTTFSSLLSPLWAVWARRRGLTSVSEPSHLLSVNVETLGAVALKRVFPTLTPLAPALQTWPD